MCVGMIPLIAVAGTPVSLAMNAWVFHRWTAILVLDPPTPELLPWVGELSEWHGAGLTRPR